MAMRYIGLLQNGAVERIEADVLIIGTGAAGLYAALTLDPGLSCALVNKAGAEESSSMYAQGGIAAVTQPDDDPELHLRDTLFAGAGLCDENAVRILVTEGPHDVERLIELGIPFDRDENGSLCITREGAHGISRILHSGGDATGRHMTEALYALAAAKPNVKVFQNLTVTDILTGDDGAVAGALAQGEDGVAVRFVSRSVIIATGGIGRVYRNSTNPRCSTGDGIAAAMRAGAAVRDMEFVQFHPTALIHPDQNGRFFLISEALRGEGAVLRNRRWERFMEKAHPLADLAPRDVVSRSIVFEMRKYDLPHVYLDITSKPRAFLQKRFPTIYHECMRRDIDIAINWIPVVPVQHFFMGGIATDYRGRTNIPGLFACGESACTGVHGANRLASNSLLECLVFGRRCAEEAGARAALPGKEATFPKTRESRSSDADIDSFRTRIRENMTKKGGIIRNEKDMRSALGEIEDMLGVMEDASIDTLRAAETFNMAMVGAEILRAALARKHSVGAHYRSDDPDNKKTEE